MQGAPLGCWCKLSVGSSGENGLTWDVCGVELTDGCGVWHGSEESRVMSSWFSGNSSQSISGLELLQSSFIPLFSYHPVTSHRTVHRR